MVSSLGFEIKNLIESLSLQIQTVPEEMTRDR